MLKQVFILFFLVTTALAETAYFAFQTHYDSEFVIKFTDDEKIKHARELLSGETTDEPHIMGRIRKTRQPYNPRYDYHIESDTVRFFNHAIEVCDASFRYTDDHLDEACGAFLPGCYLCPWTSKIVKEVRMLNSYDFQESFRAGGRHYWSNEQNCS